MTHIDEDELDRYFLGLVTADVDQARIEEHLLGCPDCVAAAEPAAKYANAMRAAAGWRRAVEVARRRKISHSAGGSLFMDDKFKTEAFKRAWERAKATERDYGKFVTRVVFGYGTVASSFDGYREIKGLEV